MIAHAIARNGAYYSAISFLKYNFTSKNIGFQDTIAAMRIVNCVYIPAGDYLGDPRTR